MDNNLRGALRELQLHHVEVGHQERFEGVL